MKIWHFELTDGNIQHFGLTNVSTAEDAIASVEGYAAFSANQVVSARPLTEQEEQEYKYFVEEYLDSEGTPIDGDLELFLNDLEGLEI